MLMKPRVIRTVETRTGKKRHVMRHDRSLDSDPTQWPIFICGYIDSDPETYEEYDDVEEVDNLCQNCKKRLVKDGR